MKERQIFIISFPPSLPRHTPLVFQLSVMPQLHSTVQVNCNLRWPTIVMLWCFFLILQIPAWFFKISQICWLVIFISTPEIAMMISLSKTWMFFKDSFRISWFQDNFRILYRLTFWDVHREMNITYLRKQNVPVHKKPRHKYRMKLFLKTQKELSKR